MKTHLMKTHVTIIFTSIVLLLVFHPIKIVKEIVYSGVPNQSESMAYPIETRLAHIEVKDNILILYGYDDKNMVEILWEKALVEGGEG